MGNCVWRAFTGPGRCEAVRVVTSTGGIMELHGTVTAERITSEFPGHGIFRRRRSSHPLLHNETLLVGHLYYLLPLDHRMGCSSPTLDDDDAVVASPPNPTTSALTPYRMSFDSHVFRRWRRAAGEEGLPLCQKATSGMWKVRLVISPEQLSRILAEESHTQVLIESVRTVAKCGAGCPRTASNSDEWSSSSGRKTSERDL